LRAIVQDKYGPSPDVLELREIDKPVVGDERPASTRVSGM
jgi:hypothetical protein